VTPAPPAPVRLGIAGCGNVLGAYWPVIEQLRHQGRVEVVACSAPERHRARVAELGISGFEVSYESFLANSDLDGVLILTPMQQHADMAEAALRAGKHVLVEKPMATDLDSARRLVHLARHHQRVLCCAPFTVLSPTFQHLARRIDQGDLGKIVAGRGRYGWAGPDWTDWFYRPGGGALFDLGVYNLTTLTGWLGPARRVTAMAGVAVPQRMIRGSPITVEAEDNIQVILDFGDGCLATVLAGFNLQQYRGPAIELYGTEGTLNLLGDDWDPRRLRTVAQCGGLLGMAQGNPPRLALDRRTPALGGMHPNWGGSAGVSRSRAPCPGDHGPSPGLGARRPVPPGREPLRPSARSRGFAQRGGPTESMIEREPNKRPCLPG
jgi:predicted dehydrogenase